MDVRTRGGVFGPGGYGGGIFDGSGMGFGGLGCTETQSRALVGFGASVSVTTENNPPFVWLGKNDARVGKLEAALNRELQARGFKPLSVDNQLGPKVCGAIAWLGTLNDVDFGANPDLAYLMQIFDEAKSLNVCKGSTQPTKVGETKPTPLPGVVDPSWTLPWAVYDAQTAEVQQALNQELDAHGYRSIGTDGKLGAGTCGAMKLAEDAWGKSYLTERGAGCQAFTAPQKKTLAPEAVATPTPEEAASTSTMRKKSSLSTAWVVGGLLGAAAIAGVYAMQKRG